MSTDFLKRNPVMAVEKLSFTYPNGASALCDVSMIIPRGSRVALLGPNGAGKSTMLLHLNGILKPHSGRILFQSEPLKYSKSSLNELRSQVGIVFQDPDSQLFSVNVYQDISFGPMNQKLPAHEVRKRVEEAMEICKIVHLRNRPTHMLSCGEKKKVAIAGVLAMKPSVLILDEPTAALDPGSCREITNLLQVLHDQGKTILLSTHDMDFAYSWADYCYVLNRGAVAAHGIPGQVFTNRNIINDNELQIPWVLRIFEHLKANALVPEDTLPPRDEEQLMGCIDKLAAFKPMMMAK